MLGSCWSPSSPPPPVQRKCKTKNLNKYLWRPKTFLLIYSFVNIYNSCKTLRLLKLLPGLSKTCSRIHSPWVGDKVDSGIGLSYWPVLAHVVCMAGRYDNSMPELTLSPRQGLRIRLLNSRLMSHQSKKVFFFSPVCNGSWIFPSRKFTNGLQSGNLAKTCQKSRQELTTLSLGGPERRKTTIIPLDHLAGNFRTTSNTSGLASTDHTFFGLWPESGQKTHSSSSSLGI